MSSGNNVQIPNGEGSQTSRPSSKQQSTDNVMEKDEFGLPMRPASRQRPYSRAADSDDDSDTFHDAEDSTTVAATPNRKKSVDRRSVPSNAGVVPQKPAVEDAQPKVDDRKSQPATASTTPNIQSEVGEQHSETERTEEPQSDRSKTGPTMEVAGATPQQQETAEVSSSESGVQDKSKAHSIDIPEPKSTSEGPSLADSPIFRRERRSNPPAISEWSHQKLAPRDHDSDDEKEEEVQWQAMPALGEFDIFDDDGRIIAKGQKDEEHVDSGYAAVGGMGKGYTRVQLDEDAQSATSMDEDTNYLFKKAKTPDLRQDEFEDDDNELRDTRTQLDTTKDLLTEGQRIAYVAVARLTIFKMQKALGDVERTRGVKKELNKAQENMELWGQKMMVRLYAHMEIDNAEQLMIEQLAEHGVQPEDLAAPLMENARIKNPLADEKDSEKTPASSSSDSATLEKPNGVDEGSEDNQDVPEVHGPQDMPHTEKIDLDLRWTVLCDLFLVLISDGLYDSRSRRLLERVASTMKITWIQICRFEKRIMDALEMQEAEFKEDHDEADNMEKRRKLALNKKYMVMGLATVGGGIVIGLSAGLLAPVIGAGLAAGFTTIGVTGTAGFLGGVGGAALITSIGVTTGGTIAVRASHRRTGHVKTFEYRPLHNNKRLNLVLSVSGWMNGKVDDVRLPFSTIDPIMGDIYSLLWEPEMLQSMGDTINILATEALTQTVQQVLGSTILVALMASIQLPVVLTKLAYLIDNPWSVSLDRANAAGLILADSLMQHHLGGRPITLLGFSLGARLIFSCLKELANRGAYGIIQNVYLFGSPIVANKDDYLRARSVIAGRFVNGYASNDWILGYLFRATSGGIMRVAGLAPVENVPGLENIDVSKLVNGHMAYRAAMPRLLREVGWEVESDEFTEIEDPDPENHQKRQRELIAEIDEARKKAEEKPEKKRFGFFKRGKLAEKKGWETYDADKAAKQNANGDAQTPGLESNVLFDVDAIRKELAGEMIEVRELDSTLPPIQITSIKDGEKHTEYLRLPAEVSLTKDEVGRMKLPPRPNDLDVAISATTTPPPPLPPKSKRLSLFNKQLPKAPYKVEPKHEDYTFDEPRELQSTLPPLQLTPSMSQEAFSSSTPARPALRTYSTTPASSTFDRTTPASPLSDVTSPVNPQTFQHNAWADDDDHHHGHEREIKMTFE